MTILEAVAQAALAPLMREIELVLANADAFQRTLAEIKALPETSWLPHFEPDDPVVYAGDEH